MVLVRDVEAEELDVLETLDSLNPLLAETFKGVGCPGLVCGCVLDQQGEDVLFEELGHDAVPRLHLLHIRLVLTATVVLGGVVAASVSRVSQDEALKEVD